MVKNKNLNILNELRERNRELLAEIEEIKKGKNNEGEGNLTSFYENIEKAHTDKIRAIREQFIKYDKVTLYDTWGRNWDSTSWNEKHFETYQILEEVGEILHNWGNEIENDDNKRMRESERAMIIEARELIIYWIRIFGDIKDKLSCETVFSKELREKIANLEQKLEEREENHRKVAQIFFRVKKEQAEKIKNLEELVTNLKKVPAELEEAQLSWYKRLFPKEFAELEKNITEKDVEMSDFIKLLIKKIGRREKNLINLQDNLKDLQESNNKFNQWLSQEKHQNRQIDAELQKERTNYHNTAIDLVKEKSQARKAAAALKKRALELRNDLASEQNQTKTLQNKINAAEQDLGTGLDNLTTELEGKTIAEYKKIAERERDELANQLSQVQIEAKNYKKQLEEVKQERDQLKTELNQKEISIITKIISELKLGLNNESNLEQVLEKIKELIVNKSPDTSQETANLRQQIAEKDEEIKKLREQNKENYLPKEIIEKKAKKIFESLNIKSSSVYRKELAQITSPQQLEKFWQEVTKKEFSKISKRESEAKKLNIILWMLLISSILTTIFLIIKIKRSKLSSQNKRTKAK